VDGKRCELRFRVEVRLLERAMRAGLVNSVLRAGIVLVLGAGLGMAYAAAQSSNPPAAPTPDPKTPQRPDYPATQKPGDNDNPFPGENSNAPVIPVEQPNAPPPDARTRPLPPADLPDATPGARRSVDADGDPVLSPDDKGAGDPGADDGFSSSRAGLNNLPAEDDHEVKPGSSVKVKTRSQLIKEDIDVGTLYLEKRNWKAAQMRFSHAYSLDPENADAIFELAEAERHLDQFKEASEHYKTFLSYDPDGPHGKAARKGLEESEAAQARK
jgi:tetratricopeptide (TPR) repeat protein